MTACIYTGDDSSYCTCSACAGKRSHPIRFDDLNDALRRLRQQAQISSGKSQRRRPCPTGIPGDLDGIVPYQPSRCANGCVCCAWCRGEEGAEHPTWCACEGAPERPRRPLPEIEWSNCERGHSALVECRGGCKPRPVAMAVVVGRPSWIERAIRRIAGWFS